MVNMFFLLFYDTKTIRDWICFYRYPYH